MAKILEYFSSATQIGLTATPKKPMTFPALITLATPFILIRKEGIEDGFLAPYKVVRVDIVSTYRLAPTKGQVDKQGQLIDDRIYNQKTLTALW